MFELAGSFRECVTIDDEGNFKIDYSSTKHICTAGAFIRSPTFFSEGYRWAIRYFPNGSHKEDNGAYISLYLDLQNKTNLLCTNFTFRLLHINGTWSATLLPVESPWRRSSCIFKTGSCCHGFRAFIEKSALDAQYVRDDFFLLSCSIKVMNKVWETPPVSYRVGLPTFRFLHDDFIELLVRKEITDVSFEVDGTIFLAHRLVLAARSPVFKAELFGSMAEANMKCIKINDMSALVFKVLLHFMYTDSLPSVVELFDGESDVRNLDLCILAQCLLVAAERYQLKGLKEICEEKLCMVLTPETVVTLLSLANQLNCYRLKDTCLKFVTKPKNFLQLAITDSYVQLMQSNPSLLGELRNRVNRASPLSRAALKRQRT